MQSGHELTEEFEADALEQAREYGEQLSPDHVCDMCADIDLQPWQHEKLKEIAGWRIDDGHKPFFRQPPEPPTEDHAWFYQEEVWAAFSKAFFENAADPESCDICLDDEFECGHERHDPDGCPLND